MSDKMKFILIVLGLWVSGTFALSYVGWFPIRLSEVTCG
jgi:hypothetical protein